MTKWKAVASAGQALESLLQERIGEWREGRGRSPMQGKYGISKILSKEVIETYLVGKSYLKMKN